MSVFLIFLPVPEFIKNSSGDVEKIIKRDLSDEPLEIVI